MSIYIGTSGWQYDVWKNNFYPPGTLDKSQLAYTSRIFNSVEVNTSYYRFLTPEVYRRWYEETPANFKFTLKAPRALTHLQRLRKPQESLANFLASGPLELKEKWAGVLWQLPPHFHLNERTWPLLEELFASLPQDQNEAAQWTHAASRFEVQRSAGPYPLYHSLEIQSETFLIPDFMELLKKYNVALVLGDHADKRLYCEDITAPHLYLRFNGEDTTFRDQYSPEQIDEFAIRISQWLKGRIPSKELTLLEEEFAPPRDIFIYFDNRTKLSAPLNAKELRSRLQLHI